ncbi:phosphatidylinositol 3,4,5-trisphosphate 3-phosphatase TPTE2-like isoform X2 [Oratosquilla oratoria]
MTEMEDATFTTTTTSTTNSTVTTTTTPTAPSQLQDSSKSSEKAFVDAKQLNFQANGTSHKGVENGVTSPSNVVRINEIDICKELGYVDDDDDDEDFDDDFEDDDVDAEAGEAGGGGTPGGGGGVPRQKRKVWSRTTKFLEYDPEQHGLEVEMGFVDPSNPPSPGCNHQYMQWRVRRFVEHFAVRVFTAVLIVIDMILLIVDLFNNPRLSNDPLEYCCLAFSTYFMIEVLLRVFALGPYIFFRTWYNILDCILVVTTFVLSVVTVCIENMASNPASLIVVLRLIRLVRITRILWERQHLKTGARQFVSQNKRRFQQDGFDLDLTYVAPRVIAMSFPSSGSMSLYRNDIKEVARFLDRKHRGRYRVYNLCSERHYEESYFHGSVERFLIDDHNVPPLTDMLKFSKSVREWMARDEANVIAVHCKGGKGRTGTMICVFLIDTGLFRDAEHCLGYFGDRRTDKNAGKKFQGVETPSQSRYVGYYERVVSAGGELPKEIPLIITTISVRGIRHVGAGDGSEFIISVKSRAHTIPFHCSISPNKNCQTSYDKAADTLTVRLMNAPVIRGDTRVMFLADSHKIPKGYENCPFFFWFHTGFINNNRLRLERQELDNPHKSKTWHVFRENFEVTLDFEVDTMTKAY